MENKYTRTDLLTVCFLFTCLVFVVGATTYVIEPKDTGQVCEHGTQMANLFCKCGQIFVKYAIYGTSGYNPCVQDGHTCGQDNDVTGRVTAMCNNRQSCSIESANNNFGDPCVGVVKYLQVSYDCIVDKPAHCDRAECRSPNNVWCTHCEDNIKFTLVNGVCHWSCSWNNRWCWPGECQGGLASGCHCQEGFTTVKDESKAQCQPNNLVNNPSISSCRLTATANDSSEVSSNSGSNKCSLQKDMYGRFQIESFSLDVNADFQVNITLQKPSYVEDYLFGITDVDVYVHKISVTGFRIDIGTFPVKLNKAPTQAFNRKINMTVHQHLNDGEKICVNLTVSAGGYLTSNNLDNNVKQHIAYDKTQSSRDICYIYDKTTPIHCKDNAKCHTEPLSVSTRLTKTRKINMSFDDWVDPYPNGDQSLASGISSYTINIYEVKELNPTEQIRDTIVLKNYTSPNNVKEIEVELPAKNPMLYAIVLEVTDVAENEMKARRFVLFDNSSVIRQDDNKPLRVESATPETKYTWQINHNNLCFSWENRFYNDKYLSNNPLRPIKSEVKDKYDQITGLLPINGTDNVNGITKFYYSLSKKNLDLITDGEIVNVRLQFICLAVKTKDGDTFTFKIQARDIMNHTYNDTVSVNIDRSVPEIIDIWLVRENQEQLYVHNSSDLSAMLLQFKAFDPHSGLREVHWAFGVYENNTVLIDEGIGIVTTDKSDSCTNITDCYCPTIGNCSTTTFRASLTKLKTTNNHIGSHNRRYFFTVKAINNAYLNALSHIDILLDESPPEVGVVLEGPAGSPDIDYTSSDEVIVHWHGFIDHESGIKFYRVALGRRCFNLTDIKPGEYNRSAIQDTSYESIRFVFPDGEGIYFVSVIAFNNAMSPSKLVCSDGVTLDKSVPKINSVSLKHAQTVESVACYKGQPWLIRQDVSKVRLLGEACISMCYNETDNELVSLLPEALENNTDRTDISLFLCTTSKRYQNNFIYAPSDLFDISWSIEEDHSQIAEVYIGFGRDITNADAPEIISYLSLHHKTKYVQRHPGLIGERKVYIFIRVQNRAGLEHKVWYGPILADESPPTCSSDIQPLVDGEYLVVNWTNSMLHDDDQQEEIGKLMFRIGVDDRFVTPYLEWNVITHGGQCGMKHQCIRYPIRRLQKYDSETGSLFFIQLHVYNYAGHFCSVNTKPFRLPSIFPPRDGIVLDLLPDSIPPYQDTDVIFDSSMFCFAWIGFNHHENVALQASLGTKPKSGNIKSFHDIVPTATGMICEKLENDLDKIQQYFVTIKASCSGGTTYASSDGFIKVSSETVRSSLNVFIGQQCDAHNRITITKIQKQQEYNFAFLSLLESLIPGTTYSMLILNNEDKIQLNHKNIHVIASYVINSKTLLTFIPLDSINQIVLNISNNEENLTEESISVHRCDVSRPLQSYTTKIPVHWSAFVGYSSLITHYEAAICQISAAKWECNNQLIFKNVGNNTATSFHTQFLEGFYKAAVKACFGNRCLQPAWSSKVNIQAHSAKLPYVKVTGTVHEHCLSILIVFEKVYCSLGNNATSANGYRWAIFSDENGRNMLSRWKVVVNKLENTEIKDSSCIDIPVYPHKPLYGCMESFCLYGVTKQTCSMIEIKNDPNIFDKNVLYDLDLRNPLAQYVHKYEHSSNIGESLSVLHDIEIDFCQSDVEIGAFLLGQSRGIIQWFLMKAQRAPNGPCSLDSMCLMSKNTTSGFVQFGNVHPIEGGLFYICATKLEQNKNSIKCSDGFLVDNSVPKGGIVSIDSNSGYIIDGSEMILKWSGFYGTTQATTLGYPSDIAFYEYAIGTHLGFNDVVQFTSAGMAQNKIIKNLRLKPGQAYFATVRAFNHVNNSVTVYSEPVVFDNTPPSIGKIYVHETTKGFVKTHQILIEWSDIHDKESGVHKFEVGIGESNDSADIVQFADVDDSFEINGDGLFTDGHRYYAIVKAKNGAGLESYTISYPFVVDGSPPDIGHVIDVFSAESITETDIDYQTQSKSITCKWYGFHDTHSYIVNYKVALGTSPGDDNVMMLTDVGLTTFKTWFSPFPQGVKYYSTVEACNGAGLCSRVTSNGITIDKSPPVPGVVVVGDPGSHSKYLPDRKTLNFAWIGFNDPQSEIDHFEACVGTSKHICDVGNWWITSLSSTFMRSDLNMTVGLRMFVTVRACNKAAMCTQRSSPGFFIDETPPVLKSKPSVVSQFDLSSSRQIVSDPSFFKVTWKFEDDRSPITRTIISMHSNVDAHVPLPDTVLTNENQYVTNLTKENILRLGDIYKVKVTACNAALLCTTAFSDEILVDYTPPHIGGFLPPLEYEVYNASTKEMLLHLKWYGFVDMESDIQSYYISVGQSYSGAEFVYNFKITANTTHDKNTNGAQIVFEAAKILPDNLVLTISAENYAGIITKEVKVTTDLVSSNTNHSQGRLLIQTHSCNVSYCNNDCTCSVRGKKCTATKHLDCHESNATDAIGINVTLITNSPSAVGSTKCLRSKWVIHSQNSAILRYEYSFGLRGSLPGNGIFDISAADPWTDVGKQTQAFYCLPHGQELEHSAYYVAHVRAWVSISEFALFTSTPVVIDHSPPSILKKRFVVDSSPSCDGDVDYILSNEFIGVCWNGVFTDAESTISTFQILLGTSPSIDDTVSVIDVGNKTYFQWTGLSFEPGTRYFATVRAINSIGYQTELSSDGFVIDDTPPTAGVVYNTGDHHDVIYHSTEEHIKFSWSGFDDEHSFIDYYLIAYLVNNDSAEPVSFINHGLSDIFIYNGKIQNNDTIVAFVKARDKTGHESTVVTSPVLHIDRTPPFFFNCDTFLQKQQQDISIQENEYSWSQMFLSNRHDVFNIHIKVRRVRMDFKAYLTIDDFSMILPFAVNADDSIVSEYTYLSDKEKLINISIQVSGVIPSSLLSIKVSKCEHLTIRNYTGEEIIVQQISQGAVSVCIRAIDMESGIKQISVGIGSVLDGLEINEFRSISTHLHHVINGNFTHGMVIYVKGVVENHAGLRSIFRARQLKIDYTPPIINNLESAVEYASVVNDTTVSIRSSWTAVDEESDIRYCEYCIGFSKTSCGVIPWTRSVSKYSFQSTTLYVEHGAKLFGNVRCINFVELVGHTRFGPLIISFLPPIKFNSHLEFITNTDLSPLEQSDTRSITVRWNEFEDISKVEEYSAQITHKGYNLGSWQNIGNKNYLTFTGLYLQNGEMYDVNIKGKNVGGIESVLINNSITVNSNKPTLTGNQITVQHVSDNGFLIKWSDLFSTVASMGSFSVSIGTLEGSSDVLMPTSTATTEMAVDIPEDVKQLYCVVMATTSTGLSESYRQTVIIR